jgi:hypothetical protein
MILQPLCTSVDLGDATAFAKKEYNRLATGARPYICVLPYNGHTDLLLCRFVIGFAPEADLVQILALQQHLEVESDGGAVAGGESAASGILTQVITILQDHWDKEGIHDTPFYAHADHTNGPDQLFEGDTGVLSGFGGGSGNPVILTSSDLSVCSVSGFNITVEGPGSVYFTLSQAGNEYYSAAPTLTGGIHIFSWYETMVGGSEGGAVAGGSAQFEANAQRVFTADGGAVAGGGGAEGLIRPVNLIFMDYAAQGGAAVADEAYVELLWVAIEEASGEGGAVASGEAQFQLNANRLMYGRGGCVGGGTASVVRMNLQRGTMTATGGSRAGGTAAWGINVNTSGGAVAGGAAQFEANANRFMQGAGGVVAGYAARFTQYNVRYGSMTATGGARASGAATFTRLSVIRGSMTATGGARASGAATIGAGLKITASGGAVVSGVAGESFTLLIYQFTASGGAVVSGSVASSRNGKTVGDGGAVVSGVAVNTLASVLKPLAMQNIAITFPYKDLDTGFVTLYFNGTGTAKRGGVLTYTILGDTDNLYFVAGVDTGGRAYYKMYKFDHYWLGNDTFSYKVTETTEDDVAVDSDVATVLVNAAAPAAMVYTVGAISSGLAKFTWTGGAYRFTFSLTGTYTGVTLLEPYVDSGEKFCIIQKAAGATTTSGYVRVTDHYGSYFSVPLSSLGVPTAAPAALQIDFTVSPNPPVINGGAAVITPIPDARGGGYSFATSTPALLYVAWSSYFSRWQVNAYAAGTGLITMTQQGANGLATVTKTKSFTLGAPPGTWEVAGVGCNWWGSPLWEIYTQGPDNVVYSPDGTYRLTWRIVKPEYRDGSAGTNQDHAPTDFADLIFGTATEDDVNWTYNNYFWPYSMAADPAVDNYIHWGLWEHRTS